MLELKHRKIEFKDELHRALYDTMGYVVQNAKGKPQEPDYVSGMITYFL